MTLYRRRKHSDTWHYHHKCQHWKVLSHIPYIERTDKPRSGEFCNECRRKSKRF